MKVETFRTAEKIISEIDSIQKQIETRQKDIYCIEKKKYSPNVDCKIKVEFREENGNSGYHNFTLIISEETILKELRGQIFARQNKLFTLKKTLEQL